jgi:membrane-bound inhibitor of C-type lysozyme
MKFISRVSVQLLFVTALFVFPFLATKAFSQSGYYTSQGCSGCHLTTPTTCNGCHAHGTHPSSAKSSINVAGATNKTSYAPGETVSVTITGGYRTGWFRAVLYNQNSVEVARSTGNDSGIGSSATYPATLSAPAPATAGTYTWKVGWYGNKYDASGAAFGAGWTPDATNPNHGYEVVSTNSFTVAAAPIPTPTISSVTPSSLVQGALNQTVTIAGTNLAGSTIAFSNAGVTHGSATVTATSITMPVSVTAGATTGAGTVTVTTGTGSASGAFTVTAAPIPAPTVSSVTPSSLVQGAVNQTVTIAGTNLAGSTIAFSNAGVTHGSATVSATSITMPVSVTAGATTGAGTVTVKTGTGSASGVFTVTASSVTDTTKPTLTVSALANGAYTSKPTLNVTGTATDAGGLKSLTVNGQAVVVNPDGSFSTALTLVEGANTVTVIATDNAGNQQTDTRTINYDPNAPVLTVTGPADNSISVQSFITISGTINETSTVSVTVNNGAPQAASITGNTFSVTVNLASGLNTINITATDLAGNSSNAKRTVTYQGGNFTLAVTYPNQDITTSKSSIVVSGKVIDATSKVKVTITMDGRNYTPRIDDGTFKQRLTFTRAKLYAISVTATDESGNSSTVIRNVIFSSSHNSRNREDDD